MDQVPVTTVTTHNGELTCRDWGHGHGLCLIPFLISLFRLLVLLVLRLPPRPTQRAKPPTPSISNASHGSSLPTLQLTSTTLLQSKALFCIFVSFFFPF